MKRPTFLVSVVVAVALLIPAAAQTQAPPGFVSVTSVKVKPDAVSEFERYVKTVNAAALKIGLKIRVTANQVIQGGSPFQYDFVSVQQSLAELDQIPSVPEMIIKAHGETEGGKILRAGRATIEGVETTVSAYREEFSAKAEQGPDLPKFMMIVATEIDPALTTQYAEYLAKLKVASDKSAAAPTAYRLNSLLGPSSTYITALPFNSWADRAKWPGPQAALTEAYGAAEATKLWESSRRAVRRQSIWVTVYRPDLSRIPSGTSN